MQEPGFFCLKVNARKTLFIREGFGPRNQGKGFGTEPLLTQVVLDDLKFDETCDTFPQTRNTIGFRKQFIWNFQC